MVETPVIKPIGQQGACLAFLVPGVDVILAIVIIASCDDTAASFGFTAHAPLAFCAVRMLGLLLALASAVGRGRSERELKWAAMVEWVYVSALPYVMMVLIATPCIVRLVADKPARITAKDDRCFWLATGIGAVCVVAESWFVLDLVPALHKNSQRNAEVRRTSSASTLNVELLDQAGDQDEPTSTSSNGTSEESKKDKDDEEEKKRTPAIKELLALVVVDWPLLIQASILLAGAAICEALIPRYVGETVSEIIRADENGTLAARPYKGPVINLLIASAFCGIFSSCRGATFIWLGSRVSSRMRQNLFDSLLSQEIGFFDTTKTGELSSRLTQDCQKTSDQVTLNVNVFLRVIVQLVVTLIFMFWLSPALTSVAFISVPAIVVISKKYGRFMQTLSEATQKALAEANSVAEEGLSTMSTIRMFAGEHLETKRFGAKLDVFKDLQQRQARFYISYLAATIWLPQATTALILFYGGKLTMEGNLDSGDLLAFVLYLQSLNGNFSALGDFYTQIVQALGAATRVFELTRREPKLPLEPPATAEAPPETQRGEIRLEDVRFSYPARPEIEVLKGLSLIVPAGKTVALVGPSGNGKSTVIGLVKRLYKAETGRVTLDGVDIWDYPHRALHRCLSIVGQEPVLYARSIKENITYGLTSTEGESLEGDAVPQERIEEATRTANAHAFITAMPKGYDTEVGERGVQLSGGQKQRIAIARALVRQPKVLLLDEATSALDAESEKQVQQAIDAMITGGGMTVVVIAHRLSTVRNSHKICVIQGGQVVEEGSHDELLVRKKAYYSLVETQLGGLDRSVEQQAKSDAVAKDEAERGVAAKDGAESSASTKDEAEGGASTKDEAESDAVANGD